MSAAPLPYVFPLPLNPRFGYKCSTSYATQLCCLIIRSQQTSNRNLIHKFKNFALHCTLKEINSRSRKGHPDRILPLKTQFSTNTRTTSNEQTLGSHVQHYLTSMHHHDIHYVQKVAWISLRAAFSSQIQSNLAPDGLLRMVRDNDFFIMVFEG